MINPRRQLLALLLAAGVALLLLAAAAQAESEPQIPQQQQQHRTSAFVEQVQELHRKHARERKRSAWRDGRLFVFLLVGFVVMFGSTYVFYWWQSKQHAKIAARERSSGSSITSSAIVEPELREIISLKVE